MCNGIIRNTSLRNPWYIGVLLSTPRANHVLYPPQNLEYLNLFPLIFFSFVGWDMPLSLIHIVLYHPTQAYYGPVRGDR